MDTFISIVIPLYNKENCILKTIQSVLDQSYANYELIIVDDGSTDKSLQVIEDYIRDVLCMMYNVCGKVRVIHRELL